MSARLDLDNRAAAEYSPAAVATGRATIFCKVMAAAAGTAPIAKTMIEVGVIQ
jgi:hypothetical protein